MFRDAEITGTYILDPWFPRISSIWGRSDPPGTFQDKSEMKRNFLEWQRPEGRYPDRDGLYITVAPTMPAAGDADPAHARDQEHREQRDLDRHPDRIAERDARIPTTGIRSVEAAITTPNPANDAATWRMVSCVAYSPRESGYDEGIERHRQSERRDERRRGRDVLCVEPSAAEQDLDERARTDEQDDGGERREDRDGPDRFRPEDGRERPALAIGVRRRQDREDGERERDADQADRHDLVVEREVEGADAADRERRGDGS